MGISLDFLDRVSVLVVGDIMLDRYIWGDIRRISPEAPVPVVEIDRETHTAGGAANVALNLAALGVRCELCGVLGRDANGQELQSLLKDKQVEFDPIFARSGTSTITKTRVIAQRQQVCRLDREMPPAAYSLEEGRLLAQLVKKAASYDAVILSDYAKGVISQPVIDAMREVRASQGRPFLSLDPKPTRALDIAGLDLITPNRQEALQLAGLPVRGGAVYANEELASRVLRKHQPKVLVVTLSEHGMLLQREGAPAQVFPTLAHQVADVSGAGDTVTAVLTAAMAAGLAPADAVKIANTAAGIVVEKLGTATVSRDEVRGRLCSS